MAAETVAKRSIWRIAFYLLTAAALVYLIVVSVLLWSEWQKRFPRLPSGKYVGTFQGIFSDDNAQALPVYFESSNQGDTLFVVLFKNDWQPQIINTVLAGSQDNQALLPIILNNTGMRLKLTGAAADGGLFRGAVVDLKSGTTGSWELKPAAVGQENNAPAAVDSSADTRLWLYLNAELTLVDERIAAAQLLVPKQKEEIEKLTDFVTKGDALKRRADEKFMAVKEELRRQNEVIKQKRDAMKQLESAFDIAQRVTSMGKLVSLSRESLEREARWVDSMLKVSSAAGSEKLAPALERAEKIIALKQEIQQERRRIKILESGGTISAEAVEAEAAATPEARAPMLSPLEQELNEND
jgi:hypothetical protein